MLNTHYSTPFGNPAAMNSLTFEARISTDHVVRMPDELPIGTLVRIHVEPLTGDDVVDRYEPHTEIGHLALAARKAYLKAGGKLLTADEINAEVRRRRGGVSDD
jgi:hypothetical protein